MSTSAIDNMNWPIVLETGLKKTRFGEEPLFKEGLYDVGNNIYAWMVPNGSWGETNAGLIVGDKQSLLVDTLWDRKFTEEMLSAMRPYTKENPIKFVVNTHSDGDHCWGNECVADAEIIATEACAKACHHLTPKALVKIREKAKFLKKIPLKKIRGIGHYVDQMQVPYDFDTVNFVPPNSTFTGKRMVDLGNRKVELMEVGPAHTPGDCLVYIPNAKTLFCGDILFVECTPVIWTGPISNWIKVLDQILALDLDVIIPGHGPITNKQGVQQLKDYWLFVEEQADNYYKQGIKYWKAAEKILKSSEFKNSAFANWDSPERLSTNIFIAYHHKNGSAPAPTPKESRKAFIKQAALAVKLPNSRPSVMHV